MNQKWIISDNILISLTLQNISKDAQQWKENELADLNDKTVTTKSWTDWNGFKKQFLDNWEEIDSSGNAYTKLQKLQKRKFASNQKWMSLIKYTEQFKELIRKAGVDWNSTTYQYGQGLTSKEYKNLIALTNPKKLEDWYEAVHCLYNTRIKMESWQAPDQNGTWI
jgi:hypothetical protein